MPDIDMKHLRAFLAIVTEGTFLAAGVKLGCSQATVSQRVATLESRLNASVFERRGRIRTRA